jgi:hypothetical protein
VFIITSIGVVDILDVDVFGGATDAIVCLDVNAQPLLTKKPSVAPRPQSNSLILMRVQAALA